MHKFNQQCERHRLGWNVSRVKKVADRYEIIFFYYCFGIDQVVRDRSSEHIEYPNVALWSPTLSEIQSFKNDHHFRRKGAVTRRHHWPTVIGDPPSEGSACLKQNICRFSCEAFHICQYLPAKNFNELFCLGCHLQKPACAVYQVYVLSLVELYWGQASARIWTEQIDNDGKWANP